MKLEAIAYILLASMLLADSAVAIKPPGPDETPVNNPLQYALSPLPEDFPRNPQSAQRSPQTAAYSGFMFLCPPVIENE